MHLHNSYAKLDMHAKPVPGAPEPAKSLDKFEQKAGMPQSGQTMNDNRRDSNYANQTGEAKKQKLVYSSAVEILNNGPKAGPRGGELGGTHKKRTANPLQKSVQLPQTSLDGGIQYGGSNDPNRARASNLMLENNNFIKKFTDFGPGNPE